MGRPERLQQRFSSIQVAIEEVHGKSLAFAAADAAWLVGISYAQDQAMIRIARFITDPVAKAVAKKELAMLSMEQNIMLQALHIQLCIQLGVDTALALSLSKNFEQVVRDICLQGG